MIQVKYNDSITSVDGDNWKMSDEQLHISKSNVVIATFNHWDYVANDSAIKVTFPNDVFKEELVTVAFATPEDAEKMLRAIDGSNIGLVNARNIKWEIPKKS